MRIISVFKSRPYFFLAAFLAIFMLGLYPFVQILPQGLNNFWFWFTILTPARWILYIFYGALFGLTAAFSIWRLKDKTCPVSVKAQNGAKGAVGMIAGMLLPQCAACFSLASLLLPASAALFLAQYTTQFMIASNLLLLITLYSMGAFKLTK